MNKVELIREVAKRSEFTQKDVATVVDAMVATMKDAMVAGEDVKLVGFGTFTVVERAAREGRNPSTGETMQIPASRAPKFKASGALKDAVKEA